MMRYSIQINTISKQILIELRKLIGKQNDTNICPDGAEIAELFNNYFVNVGKNNQSKIPKCNETFEIYISHNITTNMFLTPMDLVNRSQT